MNRGDVGLVLGLAGFLLGAGAIYTATGVASRVSSVENVQRSDNETLAGLGSKLQEVDESTKGLSTKVNGLASDPKALWDAVKDLQKKVEKLERSGAGPK